ncbi:MAG: hypothetical protein O2898_10705 [Proteobacteria bacterium]|nr:hypothetical protein [Pseudomonadota bacterium]
MDAAEAWPSANAGAATNATEAARTNLIMSYLSCSKAMKTEQKHNNKTGMFLPIDTLRHNPAKALSRKP